MSSSARHPRVRVFRLLVLLAVLLPAFGAAPLAAVDPDRWYRIGPFGGEIGRVTIDRADPQTLYAVAVGGIYRSQDGGGSWSLFIRQPLPLDPDARLAQAPSEPRTAYVLLSNGHLLKTTDAGAHWTRMTAPLHAYLSLRLLADPFTPSTVYAVGISFPELWKSTNSGASWQRIDRALLRHGRPSHLALELDPHRPGTLYATLSGTGVNRGVYRSTNGGRTWVARNQGLHWSDGYASYQLRFHPEVPDALYVESWSSNAGGRFFRSKNAGASWVSSPLPEGVGAVEAGAGGILYSDGFRSLDDGVTWLATWFSPHHRPVSLTAHPSLPGILFASSPERGIFVSPDGGFSWYTAHHGIAATNVESLAIDPRDSTLYAGVRGSGLFRLRQGQIVWEEIQEGLPFDILHYPTFGRLSFGPDGRLFYPVNRPVVEGGFQVWTTYPDEIHWEILAPPDGYRFETTPRVHPTEPETLFVSACPVRGGDPCRGFRTQDLGKSWTPLPIRASIVAMNPSRPATVFALNTVRGRFFKSLDGGATWAEVAAIGLPKEAVIELVPAPSRPDTLYAGTTGQGFFRSVDGGRTWTAGTTGLPEHTWAYSIVVDPRDADLLHAVVGWFGGQGVFRSRDGGLSWTRVRRGLPDMPEHTNSLGSLHLDPRNPDDLYLTTQGSGIYRLKVP